MNPDPAQKTTLSQGLEIVRLLVESGQSLGVSQIAQRRKMAKSSVHRLLRILNELGFVHQNPVTQCYGVSPQIFDFVHGLAAQFGCNAKVDPILRAVATRLQCSVYLCMLEGRDTYVVCAAGPEGTTTLLGTHGPVYATSAGKALVAQRPESEWPDYNIQPSDKKITAYTSLDPETFLQQLRLARASGIAWNIRESTAHHVSVAAPIVEPLWPYPRMAVALLVPYKDLVVHDRENLAREVKALADRLTRELGSKASTLAGV
jgi:DNA-binding IclR family transcriptional regulator